MSNPGRELDFTQVPNYGGDQARALTREAKTILASAGRKAGAAAVSEIMRRLPAFAPRMLFADDSVFN